MVPRPSVAGRGLLATYSFDGTFPDEQLTSRQRGRSLTGSGPVGPKRHPRGAAKDYCIASKQQGIQSRRTLLPLLSSDSPRAIAEVFWFARKEQCGVRAGRRPLREPAGARP